jgi:hypothetical protein
LPALRWRFTLDLDQTAAKLLDCPYCGIGAHAKKAAITIRLRGIISGRRRVRQTDAEAPGSRPDIRANLLRAKDAWRLRA